MLMLFHLAYLPFVTFIKMTQLFCLLVTAEGTLVSGIDVGHPCPLMVTLVGTTHQAMPPSCLRGAGASSPGCLTACAGIRGPLRLPPDASVTEFSLSSALGELILGVGFCCFLHSSGIFSKDISEITSLRSVVEADDCHYPHPLITTGT